MAGCLHAQCLLDGLFKVANGQGGTYSMSLSIASIAVNEALIESAFKVLLNRFKCKIGLQLNKYGRKQLLN